MVILEDAKMCKERNLKITNLCTKIKNMNKCNMQRIKTSDKRFLFVCGDIELNPGQVNIPSMSVSTTRLARIGQMEYCSYTKYAQLITKNKL